MNTVIDNTAGLDSKSDNQLEWELLKVKIKHFIRNYSKQKSLHNRNTLAELYGKLNDSALAANPECVATQNQRDQVKIKIELLEQQKSRAAQVRARSNG